MKTLGFSEIELSRASEIQKALNSIKNNIRAYKIEIGAGDSDFCSLIQDSIDEYERFQRKNEFKRSVLYFNGGCLEKLKKENGEQFILNLGRKKLYGYVFNDRYGRRHELLSENDFSTLSIKRHREIIEKELLSDQNIYRADLDNIQDGNSQYGYIGGFVTDKIGDYFILNDNIIKKLRNHFVNRIKTLEFGNKKLHRKLDKNGKQVKRKIGDCDLYFYIIEENDEKKSICTQMSFEELSEFSKDSEIMREFLSDENLKKDIASKYYGYGFNYIGEINDFNGYMFINHDLIVTKDLIEFVNFLPSFSKAKKYDEQKKIRLSNGKSLYGYSLFDKRNQSTVEFFLENDFEDFKKCIKDYKKNGYNQLDFCELISDTLEKKKNSKRLNANSKYLYVGKFLGHGEFRIDENIENEIKNGYQRDSDGYYFGY